MVDRDRDWDFHLRSLSSSARDSNFANDPASDSSLLYSVKKLYELCKAEKSEDLVARVYPQFNKLFQRSVASISQSRTSIGLLLLAILQFFLDFGEAVLHDADPSLRMFFRSCLSREFADPLVAEATLDFLNVNRRKLLTSFPTLLPQVLSEIRNISVNMIVGEHDLEDVKYKENLQTWWMEFSSEYCNFLQSHYDSIVTHYLILIFKLVHFNNVPVTRIHSAIEGCEGNA